ncbi:MAG TPA: 30S ribosomal protein S17 [Alphaproteobacteria bacterium]|nr:30S ribosomal protein S17 [Alphaproteobacteria bacterium]
MPKRELQGVVVSAKANKTVAVRVDRKVAHPIYKKFVVKSKKFQAHDEQSKFKEGDFVKIRESKPFSKTKTWEVVYPS